MTDDTKQACSFIRDLYKEIGGLAPDRFSPEEQHAIYVLAAYIREKAKAQGADDEP